MCLAGMTGTFRADYKTESLDSNPLDARPASGNRRSGRKFRGGIYLPMRIHQVPVGVIGANVAPLVPARQNVIRCAGILDTDLASHRANSAREPSPCQEAISCFPGPLYGDATATVAFPFCCLIFLFSRTEPFTLSHTHKHIYYNTPLRRAGVGVACHSGQLLHAQKM